MDNNKVVNIDTPLKKFEALMQQIVKDKEDAKQSKPKSFDADNNVDTFENNAMHKHKIDTNGSINSLIVKLVFVGLLFLLILALLAYLFASNSTVFSSELPKHISLLVIGILGMIAWVGYGWIGRNERSGKKEQ